MEIMDCQVFSKENEDNSIANIEVYDQNQQDFLATLSEESNWEAEKIVASVEKVRCQLGCLFLFLYFKF